MNLVDAGIALIEKVDQAELLEISGAHSQPTFFIQLPIYKIR